MSRTIRRRAVQWKFKWLVGSFEEWCAPSPGYPNHESWEAAQSKKSGVSLERMFQQRVAWFYRDTKPGRRSAPRWFRKQYGSKHVRLQNSHALHVCNKNDEWDQHLAYPFVNNAGWFWF